MKLAFITLGASLLGVALVTASNAAGQQDVVKVQDRAPMTERAEPVRLAEVSPCAPAPETFACVDGRGGKPDARRGPPPGGTLGSDRPFRAGPGPLMLASRLGAIETFVGISADQLGAWRAYTDALQAMIRPPAPPEDRAEPPDALAQSAAFARHAAEQGQQALKLAAAIDTLRGKLSAEQIERLKQAGPLLPPRPPGPEFGGPGFGGPGFGAPPLPFPASFGPPGPGAPGAGHITPP